MLFLSLLSLFIVACSTTPKHKTIYAAHWQVRERLLQEKNAEAGYTINVHYPELISSPNRAAALPVNQAVQELIVKNMKAFKAKVPHDSSNLKDYPPEMRVNNLNITYSSQLLKPKQEILLSLRFAITTIFSGNAIPTHYYSVLNYNLSQQVPLSLEGLFKKNSDYLERISHYCNKKLVEKLNLSMPWMPENMEGTSANLENFKIWNIEQKGLAITFRQYQLEPYTSSAQTIVVPYSILSPVLDPASPLDANIVER